MNRHDAPNRSHSVDNDRVRATIDLHCHVLPGVDDGARDLDDAIAMARQAEADGIAAICATPHIRHDHDVRIPELPERLAELVAAVREAGCGTQILSGAEVAATALDGLDDGELAAVTLGRSGRWIAPVSRRRSGRWIAPVSRPRSGRWIAPVSRRRSGRWILLEPAPGPLDAGLEAAVDDLRVRGFRALVAHPERHLAPDVVERLRRLVARGALVQATAAYLTDEATRPGMLALARARVLHVLGSDSHSSRAGRPVALAAALEVLRTVASSPGHLDWMAHLAPQAIVQGKDLAPPF